MSDSLVSVVIPAYNRAKLLEECLQSVNSQKYRPIQVIVVDDASDEPIRPSIDHVNWTGKIDVEVIRCPQNAGPGASRERGRLKSQGEYVSYLDSDDLWAPDKTHLQVDKLRSRPEAGMCYCLTNVFRVDPDSEAPVRRRGSRPGVDRFLPAILNVRPWATASCLWTRSAVNEIGPWSNRRLWEDMEYECRAGCKDILIACVDEVLCYQRQSPDHPHASRPAAGRLLPEVASALADVTELLHRAGKLEDQTLTLNLLSRLYNQGVESFAGGAFDDGVRCLKLAGSLGRNSRLGLFARLALTGFRHVHQRRALQIARGLRRWAPQL